MGNALSTPPRPGRPGLAWIAVVALGLSGNPSFAELIYDNSLNDRSVFLSLPEEFGDEIDFAGSARTVTSMAFTVFGERDLPDAARVVIRIYANDGPPLPFDSPIIPTPGQLLYESDPLPIHVGVQAIRIVDLSIPVPNTVTWTVEFPGAGWQNGERAGLQVFHPPTVGRSFRDYWVRTVEGFELRLLEGNTPGSFAARFEAQPDPPVTVTAQSTPDGIFVQVAGPVGTDQVLERSIDGQTTWHTVAVVSLATTSPGTYRDTSVPAGTTASYRARQSPYTGSSVVLKSIRRNGQGSRTLDFQGPRNSSVILESSSDQERWTPLDVVHLLDGTATYEDTTGSGSQGFYRTRHPTGRGPVYLIRSIRRLADGSVVLSCSGTPAANTVIVEASTDLVTWNPVGGMQFIRTQVEFHDPSAANRPLRHYRLRN